jgi:hypothetical protein
MPEGPFHCKIPPYFALFLLRFSHLFISKMKNFDFPIATGQIRPQIDNMSSRQTKKWLVSHWNWPIYTVSSGIVLAWIDPFIQE